MKFLHYATALIIVAALAGCGGSGDQYSYDVTVSNNTDTLITVRYDRASWWTGETWLSEQTVPAGDFKRLQWVSGESAPDVIEVLYLEKKRRYSVSQQDMVVVSVGDFQN